LADGPGPMVVGPTKIQGEPRSETVIGGRK
jgi:hypothetical protein